MSSPTRRTASRWAAIRARKARLAGYSDFTAFNLAYLAHGGVSFAAPSAGDFGAGAFLSPDFAGAWASTTPPQPSEQRRIRVSNLFFMGSGTQVGASGTMDRVNFR